jgi:hypothetical protein
MRFPYPVAVTCLVCGQPTVVAETAIGSERVHCGTWRRHCGPPATSGTPATSAELTVVKPVGRTVLDLADDQGLAA